MESMKPAKAPEVARSDMETERIDDFRCVVERYQSLVWAIAYSITGDSSLSEDVAQETFLAAWNQQANIRDLSKLKPYLATIARNLGRRAIRGTGREVPETDTEVEDVDTRGPLDEVIKREELSQVNVALGQMPMSSREAFVLFYAEGQSVARVADQLELSPSAVKQRLYRARESLKESLATALSDSIAIRVPGKAFAAATMTLILSQGTAAAASIASVQASETLATTGLPTSPFAISGKLVAGAVLVAVSAVAILVFLAQSETSNDEEAEVPSTATHESNQPRPSAQAPDLRPRPAGQLQLAEIQVPDNAKASVAPNLLATRILSNWPDADFDGDGQLSEEEILVLRDTQEDELTKQIIGHWQDEYCGGGGEAHPPVGVTCAFVGHGDDGQAQEGWVPYNLYGLRARFEAELEAGHAMDAQQWVASKVATAQKERVCYEITASHHDLVHKLRGDAQRPLPWVASVTFEDKEPLRFPPPKELRVELTSVADESEADEVAKRWGVQLLVLGTDEQHIAITEAFIAELATLPAAIRVAMEAE